MRDLRKQMLKLDRTKRRMALAILLISATPSLAGTPDSFIANSRGPADRDVRSRPVYQNPFCEVVPTGQNDPVQLASGAGRSTIHLKPVGKAIGLKSLGNRDAEPSATQVRAGSEMTIEIPASIVQTNPLIGSLHRSDGVLVDADVSSAVPRSPSIAGPRRSTTIVLKPAVRTRSVEVSEVSDEPTLQAPSQRPVGQTELTTPKQISQPIDSDDAQEPVRYSLSDQSSSQHESGPKGESVYELSETRALNTLSAQPQTPSPIPLAEMLKNPNSVEPLDLDEASELTFEPPLTTQRFGGQVIVQNQDSDRSQGDKPKRYRPPVAVKPVPLEIERSSAEGVVDGPIRAIQESELNGVARVSSAAGEIATLRMSFAQVRSLTLGGTLQSIQMSDTSICKVVESGSRQLKLIGTGEGTTKLFVVAEGDSPGRKPLQRVFEIHVSEAPQANGDSLSETAMLLNRSIQETFPDCEVAVLERGNELMVAGRCDSQASAKKIMRMVRKTCLVPVKDELIVH